jgi:hypothetical protein
MESNRALSSTSVRFSECHSYGAESAVDVQNFARDASSQIGAEKRCCISDILGGDIAADR